MCSGARLSIMVEKNTGYLPPLGVGETYGEHDGILLETLPVEKAEQENEMVWIYPCRHSYLEKGIMIWNSEHNKCPMCSQEIKRLVKCGINFLAAEHTILTEEGQAERNVALCEEKEGEAMRQLQAADKNCSKTEREYMVAKANMDACQKTIHRAEAALDMMVNSFRRMPRASRDRSQDLIDIQSCRSVNEEAMTVLKNVTQTFWPIFDKYQSALAEFAICEETYNEANAKLEQARAAENRVKNNKKVLTEVIPMPGQ